MDVRGGRKGGASGAQRYMRYQKFGCNCKSRFLTRISINRQSPNFAKFSIACVIETKLLFLMNAKKRQFAPYAAPRQLVIAHALHGVGFLACGFPAFGKMIHPLACVVVWHFGSNFVSRHKFGKF